MSKSPIEQHIAEQTDRRARYERAQREAGFRRTTLWVKEDCIDDVRTVIRILNATNGNHRAAIKALLDEWSDAK